MMIPTVQATAMALDTSLRKLGGAFFTVPTSMTCFLQSFRIRGSE